MVLLLRLATIVWPLVCLAVWRLGAAALLNSHSDAGLIGLIVWTLVLTGCVICGLFYIHEFIQQEKDDA